MTLSTITDTLQSVLTSSVEVPETIKLLLMLLDVAVVEIGVEVVVVVRISWPLTGDIIFTPMASGADT